jgi:hypothetical protein
MEILCIESRNMLYKLRKLPSLKKKGGYKGILYEKISAYIVFIKKIFNKCRDI